MRGPLVLIVGEAPSQRGWKPFAGSRRSSSGWRLAKLLGTTPDVLLNHPRILVTNLFPKPVAIWDAGEAAKRAGELQAEVRPVLWILLGRRVAETFCTEHVKDLTPVTDGGVTYVNVPHPSGRNLLWNSEHQRRKARKMLTALVREALKDELAENRRERPVTA